MTRHLLTFLLCALCFSCSRTDASPPADHGSQPKPESSSEVVKRGETLPEGTYLPLEQIANEPEKFADQEVLVRGQATAVCQAKGCWMTLAGEDGKARARVTFKNYGFFVPKDAKGMSARMAGQVKVKFLSEGERAHLAEDGRVDVSEIPKAELRIIASGIELRP